MAAILDPIFDVPLGCYKIAPYLLSLSYIGAISGKVLLLTKNKHVNTCEPTIHIRIINSIFFLQFYIIKLNICVIYTVKA